MTLLDPDDPGHRHVRERLATAWIAWLEEPGVVVVFSDPHTAKVGHLRRRRGCALGIETEDGGNDVVILEGAAHLAADADPHVQAAAAVFATKYEPALPGGLEEWRQAFSQAIVVRPSRIVGWSKPAGELRYTRIETEEPWSTDRSSTR